MKVTSWSVIGYVLLVFLTRVLHRISALGALRRPCVVTVTLRDSVFDSEIEEFIETVTTFPKHLDTLSGKQCRLRSDAMFCGVRCESTLCA